MSVCPQTGFTLRLQTAAAREKLGLLSMIMLIVNCLTVERAIQNGANNMSVVLDRENAFVSYILRTQIFKLVLTGLSLMEALQPGE